MSWTGKQPCPFTIQILIQIPIFKIAALHLPLVCDSENRCTKASLVFPVVCFINVFDQTLAEQLYRDKRLFEARF